MVERVNRPDLSPKQNRVATFLRVYTDAQQPLNIPQVGRDLLSLVFRRKKVVSMFGATDELARGFGLQGEERDIFATFLGYEAFGQSGLVLSEGGRITRDKAIEYYLSRRDEAQGKLRRVLESIDRNDQAYERKRSHLVRVSESAVTLARNLRNLTEAQLETAFPEVEETISQIIASR